MERDEYVYTDVAFERIREKHIRQTVEVSAALVSLNGYWWAYYAGLHGATSMIWVDGIHAVAATGIFLFSRTFKNVPVKILGHLLMVLAFSFIWSFLVVIEGLPSDQFPTLNHLWFIAVAVGALLVFVDSNFWRITYATAAFVSFVAWDRAFFNIQPIDPLPASAAAEMFPVMEAGVYSGVFITVFLMAGVFVLSISQAETQLAQANKRLETLVGNMLPKPIADRLRQEGKTFADGHAECSVLFVDIVGFTSLTTKLSPEELVALLNRIFIRFDELTEEFGLEKIKTIGDAYMVAGGLPDPREDHATACVSLALKMRETIREYAELRVRIGINSGDVIAGVIGKRRFIYDLWGDTVNIASRMESQGVKDEIQISERTAELVKHEFALKPRGEVDLKGRGPMPVFLVLGRRIVTEEASEDPKSAGELAQDYS